jgi:hypothetical protein
MAWLPTETTQTMRAAAAAKRGLPQHRLLGLVHLFGCSRHRHAIDDHATVDDLYLARRGAAALRARVRRAVSMRTCHHVTG